MPSRVAVNSAQFRELLALPGVGIEQADRIVRFRRVHGPIVDESELAAETRALVTRIVDGIGVSGRIDVNEDDEVITVSCAGSDLGMLIGRHGQTIDAVQYLANAVMWRRHPQDRKEVVVDAAGYRDRRRVALESLAVRSAERALSDHEPVELEPMTAVERKVVHLRLKEFDGVETTSEGTEPNRFVVVHPVA